MYFNRICDEVTESLAREMRLSGAQWKELLKWDPDIGYLDKDGKMAINLTNNDEIKKLLMEFQPGGKRAKGAK